jgi:antitoxin MazE
MYVSVIPIGNSKGIRLPQNVITELKIKDKVEMQVHDNKILIMPITGAPRQGWEEAFSKMHKEADDKLVFPSVVPADDSFDWEW